MQSHPVNTITDPQEEEIFSFRNGIADFQHKLANAFRYGTRFIILFTIAGIVLGLAYAWIKKDTYTARLTFVVEDSKASGGSMASAIAGQFGFDIGSLSGSSNVLAGDNMLELLKSRTLIRKALLTPFGDSAANHSLADEYANAYQWKEKWKSDKDVGMQVSFATGRKTFTRLEDSLLQVVITRISEKELTIAKPDKKLGFFTIELSTRDEQISKVFVERILKVATDFYVDAKTKRQSTNVLRLQKRADSLGLLLDSKTYSSAEASRNLLDANPIYSSPLVNAEISSRNKLIQGTVYAEVIKNLEVSRTALIQETPTVQIVDYPDLPLKRNRVRWYAGGLIGGGIGFIGILLFLVYFRKDQNR